MRRSRFYSATLILLACVALLSYVTVWVAPTHADGLEAEARTDAPAPSRLGKSDPSTDSSTNGAGSSKSINSKSTSSESSSAEKVDHEELSLDELKRLGAQRSNYRNRVLATNQDAANGASVEVPESASSEPPQPDLTTFRSDIQPILKRVCHQCHGPDTQEGNVRIDQLNPDLQNGDDVDWWVEIQAVLSNDEMPPPDSDKLTDQERSLIVEWLANELHTASVVRRASGQHTSFRRMTRYEYNYALQDLLGLPWNFAKDLPPEARSEDGFQNSSETLHMSLRQLETYRRLARQALKRATVVGDQPPVRYWGVTMTDASRIDWSKQAEQIEKTREKYKSDPDKQKQELEKLNRNLSQSHSNTYYRDLKTGRTVRSSWAYYGARYAHAPTTSQPKMPESFDHVAVLPGGRDQKLIVELGNQIPDDGMLHVRVRASRDSKTDTPPPSLQLDFGWRASNEGRAAIRVSTRDQLVEASPESPQFYEWTIPLGDIYPRNSVRKTSPMGKTPSPSEYVRFVNSSASPGDIRIEYVEVSTPVFDQWPPASHTRIFFDSENRSNEPKYAREVLTAFMTKAWRRTVSADELQQKLSLFDSVRSDCDSFEEAMVEVLSTVLSSPSFLYIVHNAPSGESPEDRAAQQLSAEELATRLAMFLWSSVPDEQLLKLARNGQLQKPEILDREVTRMLADPRAKRLSQHFVYQWLNLQILDFLSFDQRSNRVDPLLKEAMQHEPIALFQEVLDNNSSVLDFLHADYTMVNERLARHYGISNVFGNDFRRVELTADRNRGGILTQAGLLAMNSDGEDSHPLKRGVWLLESILNDPPPPPPPAVPEIDLADPAIAKMTLKERIEDHRNHAACMSCHSKIDPWGIAFENYDALGRWRNQIEGQPVDATSTLFNNQKLAGMDGLKRFLLANRQDQFVRSMVHKMATYALGRPLAFADRSRIDEITADVRHEGDGLATIVKKIATSELFMTR